MTKILICDDEYDILLSVRVMLESEGYEVETASNGKECIEKALETKPDFIFLDIMMPEMDGWTVLEKIKSYEELKDIPVSMLTVKQLKVEEFNPKKMEGLVAYMFKPFTNEEIIETIEEYI